MKKLVLLFLILNCSQNSFAQGGSGGNGGDVDETYIIGAIKNIETFLRTPVGRKEFPMLSADDLKSKIESTDVTIVKTKLIDRKNNLRSATNDCAPRCLIQIVGSDIERSIVSDPTRGGLVILIFHEYLNLLGHELNKDPARTSSYTISSRIRPFAKRILEGDFDTVSVHVPGFSNSVIYSLNVALEIQAVMGEAMFKVLYSDPVTKNTNESHRDANLICQECGTGAQCAIYQTGQKIEGVDATTYREILKKSKNVPSQVLNQAAQQQQIQQQQTQQQQQQQQQTQQEQQQQRPQELLETQRFETKADQNFEELMSLVRSTTSTNPTLLDSDTSEKVWRTLLTKPFPKDDQLVRGCTSISTFITCAQSIGDGTTCYSYR